MIDLKLSEILKTLSGKGDLTISADGKPLLFVSLNGKEIKVDVKDAFALVQMGIAGDILKGGGKKSEKLQKLKDAGFKIKIKYKLFEFEI
ncbi:MAG: hypothetical protein HY512_01155 [Candidatus Aenigmarchaeota archaeon]|nr:hypothetical protein [Candidatus Aenigmarchaeota archaeon]